MASSKNNKNSTNITRITASDDSTKKEKAPKKKNVAENKSAAKKKNEISKSAKPRKNNKGFFKKLGNYFKGSWQELKKVQWPDRKATWSLTIAVLVFTAFFMVVILLIDILFQELFNILLAR